MKTIAIKKEIHHAINLIEDKDFLKAVYVILNEKSREYDYELRDDDKVELDSFKKQNKAGKLKSLRIEQIRKDAYSNARK